MIMMKNIQISFTKMKYLKLADEILEIKLLPS